MAITEYEDGDECPRCADGVMWYSTCVRGHRCTDCDYDPRFDEAPNAKENSSNK